ncbi:MAG: ABC transporter ATP-binding protein [Candidatus Heimdallarchaeaceae archaeon]
MRIIEVENLNKIYVRKKRKGFKRQKTKVHALKDVSFYVEEGEIFSLLGPNGAGKTTLIKILTTLLLPTSGKATVLGYDVMRRAGEVRKRINAMLMGERSIYWKLTGRQNLEYFAALYHIPSSVVKVRIEHLIHELSLEDFIDRKVETYSSGQKFKVAFAKSMINDPPLLFLDEPTATLDPRAAREVRDIIKQLNEKGTTIFLTTHNMHEADELSDRVAILDLGEIIDLDTPDILKDSLNQLASLRIEIPASIAKQNGWQEELKTYPYIKNVGIAQKTNGNSDGEKAVIRITAKKELNLTEIINVLEDHNVPVLSINTERPSLEDVFLKKTGRLLSQDTSQRN